MEDYEAFDEATLDNTRVNIEVPKWVRTEIKQKAKDKGMSMMKYLEWLVSERFCQACWDKKCFSCNHGNFGTFKEHLTLMAEKK